MIGTHRRTSRAAALSLLAIMIAGCGGGTAEPSAAPTSSASPAATPTQSAATLRPGTGGSQRGGGSSATDHARVVVISVDGLGSRWVTPELTPHLNRLLAEGAGTRNARTEVEQTETLPNHTSMVTGRRIEDAVGHGVSWNTDTDQQLRPGVSSVFSVIDDFGGSSAVVTGKTKFDIWPQAWPDAIDTFEVRPDMATGTALAIGELAGRDRELTFLHLRGPDYAGHHNSWGSSAYLAAVRRADDQIGRVVSAITGDPELTEDTVLIVTADHGGPPGADEHSDGAVPADYTIPFVVWGAGVQAGDLYRLDPDYADPGTTQPSYDGPQPVRNGDVANLVTDLLGLPDVPGSEIGAGEGLDIG